MAEHTSCPLSGVFAVVHRQDTVDHDGVKAGAVVVGVGEFAMVPVTWEIQDEQVCMITSSNSSTIVDMERLARKFRDLVHCLFQRQQGTVEAVIAKVASKSPVSAGMGAIMTQRTIMGSA